MWYVSKNIENGLKSIPGISKVSVDLDSKTTSVTYDSQKANVKTIENSISKSGYQANNLKADPVTYESFLIVVRLDSSFFETNIIIDNKIIFYKCTCFCKFFM